VPIVHENFTQKMKFDMCTDLFFFGCLIQDHSKWVICRVYERDNDDDDGDGTELSCLDEVFLSLDDLEEISLPN